MSVPYKNPISSVQVSTPQSVSRTSVFGTNFSILNVGGYMEVYNLSDLSLTLTASTYPSLIQLSANTIPIRYTKGNGTFLSPDYITLNSDNISSGRRRLGMLVYVHETDKVYQYIIPNYDTLWNNLSGLTGFSSVTYSDYTTVINSRSSAGQSFLSGWTSSNIEGVSGFTSSNSNWRIFQTGSGSGGNYLPLSGGSIDGVVSITPTTTDYPLLINSRNFVDGSSGARMFFFTPSGVTYSSINVRSNGGTSSGNLLLQADGNGSVGINTSTSNPTLNYNLDVRGTFGATSVSATTISGMSYNGSNYISTGTYGSAILNASNNQSMIVFSGSNTIGGTGYTDFIKVTNTAAGATNINKTFRVNNTGGLEIVNSAYNNLCFSISDSGNLVVVGSVTANAWVAGQTIQTKLFSASDLSFTSDYTNNTNIYTAVVSGTYTPLSTSSYIFFEVYAMYFVDGAAGDSFFSQITWNGIEIGVQRQVWANGSGGGTRSGTLFPLVGRVTNGSTTGYGWSVNVRRDSSDDTITVYNNSGFYVKITEIAR